MGSFPAGITGLFGQTTLEVPPGASNFRDVSLTLTPPPGTAPDNYPFSITATSTATPATSGQAPGMLTVVGNGVDVLFNPLSGPSGGSYDLIVINTGQVADTFTLTLGGPAALVATLPTMSVMLAPSAFERFTIPVDLIDVATPGSVPLTATATSQGNTAVRDTATATTVIEPTQGLTAAFSPPARQPQPQLRLPSSS